ncbi:TetR/AcrR family transcriptional regulator C-terminal domain-containing protein [Streptomyces sp. NPDC001532]
MIHVPPADSPDWRAAASEAAGSFRATALRHPWLPSVLARRAWPTSAHA